mmetsp:Transcript_118605/g.335500  ORF Transcript_118605/g.335500 Transcript_118605/m.335500 type:complete len:205 (-) Transcript_118605:695-1309(-)
MPPIAPPFAVSAGCTVRSPPLRTVAATHAPALKPTVSIGARRRLIASTVALSAGCVFNVFRLAPTLSISTQRLSVAPAVAFSAVFVGVVLLGPAVWVGRCLAVLRFSFVPICVALPVAGNFGILVAFIIAPACAASRTLRAFRTPPRPATTFLTLLSFLLKICTPRPDFHVAGMYLSLLVPVLGVIHRTSLQAGAAEVTDLLSA